MFGFFKRLWAEHEAFQARKQAAAEEAKAAAALEARELHAKKRRHYDNLPVYREGVACPACGSTPSNKRFWVDSDYSSDVIRVDCMGCNSYFCCRPVNHTPPLTPAEGAEKKETGGTTS